MELHVENLGPLSSVRLPIRQLNVIIGPNHQGKTWLAYVLYALTERLSYFNNGVLQGPLTGEMSALTQAARTFLENANAFAVKRLSSFFQDSSGIIGAGKAVFNVTDDELIEALKSSDVRLTEDGRLLPPIRRKGARGRDKWRADELNVLLHGALGSLVGGPFALPAERVALILVYKLLALKRTRMLRDMRRMRRTQTEEQQALQEKLYRDLGEPRFPQPVEDFLDFLNMIEVNMGQPRGRTRQQTISPRVALADRLEEGLLGSHRLKWEPTGLGGADLTLQVGRDRPLELHNASSAVKQIAPLLLWLRSGLEQRLLIIDEPELNLHPVSQAKLLEGLAILSAQGVRVVLTTHSPYLLSHLNSLIAGHPTDAAIRARQAEHLYLGDPRAFLPAGEVGAWQLDQGALTDLIDPEWGVRSDTLSDASEELQRRYFAVREAAEPEGTGGQG